MMPPEQTDWTFATADTRQLTHCYHDYPARMIPQVAGQLLDRFGHPGSRLFDPYCGSGTSLVEGLLRGINVMGSDLNPLARLIATAKTDRPPLDQIDHHLLEFETFRLTVKSAPAPAIPDITGIRQLDFWFNPPVIEKLTHLKNFINRLPNGPVKRFFQVAFSETVRQSSNTRNGEFKLYRYPAKQLAAHNPAVFEIMAAKLRRNRAGLVEFLTKMAPIDPPPTVNIYDFNTVESIPATCIPPASVDIIVTSPPYGDSRTTVAYGQYSRLSAAWLALPEPAKTDRRLMGGTTYSQKNDRWLSLSKPRSPSASSGDGTISPRRVSDFPSEPLNEAIEAIAQVDAKRATEVTSFYIDLYNSMVHIADIIKPGGYACYVVGNRRVKGVTLPTDVAIRHFFEAQNLAYIATYHRTIPNKRMPLRNSPTNVVGAVDQTMAREYIVVMQQPKGA